MGHLATRLTSWEYRGPATTFDDVVGHEAAKRRLRALVAVMERPDEARAVGILPSDDRPTDGSTGLVLAGPSGTGKSMLARATAGALRRRIVVPPVAELSAADIRALYEHLDARDEPSAVLLDEADGLLAGSTFHDTPQLGRALCAAIDGMARSRVYTIALTTHTRSGVDPAVRRRLYPSITIGLPTEDDRRAILRRRLASVPGGDAIDLEYVVRRTARWTGSDLVSAVSDAVTRRMLEGPPHITQEALVEVIAEAGSIADGHGDLPDHLVYPTAVHEAGHALYAARVWGVESVEAVALEWTGARTVVSSAPLESRVRSGTVRDLRLRIAHALAGVAAERAIIPPDEQTIGHGHDRAEASRLALDLVCAGLPYEPLVLSARGRSPIGDGRMRERVSRLAVEECQRAMAEAARLTDGHLPGLRLIAKRLLESPDRRLEGAALQDVLREALG